MIWNREEYIAHMNFEFTGKEMFCELFGPLIGLDKEWAAQGASESEINLSAFGHDSVSYVVIGPKLGAITDIVPRVIEDTKEHKICMDSLGRTTKLCKSSATIALPIDYPVKNFDDWSKIKHYYEFSEERVDLELLREAKKMQDKGVLIRGAMLGGFDEPRQLMGEEELCVAYYEQPDLIHDILSTLSDTAVKAYERVFEVLSVDSLSVHEDMAGKSGPLAGPQQVQEFILPYYRRVWDFVSANGCTIFSQDSDGNMNSVIDDFIQAGMNCTYPCEPAAGMDIVQLREKYGKKLTFKGGIDKHVLRGTKNEILRELEYKLGGITRGGGTIFALDHRIPNGTPIDNYRFYVKTAREMLNLPPSTKSEHVRMAF
ncbi:MAG: hypothetical protein M0R40_06200 [Firmicutes bacterium]|nr:hypothetical protein [Bacillota bacterium]